MKVLTLTHAETKDDTGASCTYDSKKIDSLLEEIGMIASDGVVGEKWIITVEEMPQGEFENLDEFNGW